MSSPRPFLRTLTVIILIVVALLILGYFFRSHGHFMNHAMPSGHHHAGASAPAALTLNPGQRWATDAPLRTGMQHIRDAVASAVANRTAGELTAARSQALAAAVQDNVNYMFQHCQLSPEADAGLHVLLTELLQGAGQIRATPGSVEGFTHLTHALGEYPRYFDHPGWSSLPDSADY